jgi:23S rRNA (adenine2503-C2)-methyltransferase
MNKTQSLLGFLPDDINDFFSFEESFRGKQIFRWVAEGASSFDEMTNIPLALRRELSEKAALYQGSVKKTVQAKDGTLKLQIEFGADTAMEGSEEAIAIESVILTDEAGRKTACVSSQAGCPLQCAFCQTGRLGFKRNLSAAEIVEQIFLLEQSVADNRNGVPFDNIVFMGMGEPLLNLDAVRKAIAVLTHKSGKALSPRRITVSTAGIIDGIYDLADNGPMGVRLAVSLTTCDEELRARLMPVAKTNPLSELKKAILYWRNKTGKRCTLEAALFSGVNTDAASMKSLASFSRDVDGHINLIPWNTVEGLPFTRPSPGECKKALAVLENEGINATLRMSRGGTIAGACGQLGKM